MTAVMMSRKIWFSREGYGNRHSQVTCVVPQSEAPFHSFYSVFTRSSLNWVTPQMLDVPFPDKETAVMGDPFLPAITGDLQVFASLKIDQHYSCVSQINIMQQYI